MPYSLPPTPQPLNEIRPSAKKRTSAPVHSFTLIVISNRSFLCERGARSEVLGASGTSNRSSQVLPAPKPSQGAATCRLTAATTGWLLPPTVTHESDGSSTTCRTATPPGPAPCTVYREYCMTYHESVLVVP
eukprot:COSAG01_NODE_1334_length_10681_cov_10.259025_3_plen_132_part_00